MKQKYILTFPSYAIEEPITYNLVKSFNIKINILKAEIASGQEGNLLIEMQADEANIENGLKYLRINNIECHLFSKQINFRKEDCVDCGACTAVCFAGALKMENTNWKLQFDAEKCVACGLCSKACPLRLFEIKISN